MSICTNSNRPWLPTCTPGASHRSGHAGTGGEVFRSGCCFYRDKGRVFYFSPGHETYPVYHQPEIQAIIANAVRWSHVVTPATIETHTSPESKRDWFLQNAQPQEPS